MYHDKWLYHETLAPNGRMFTSDRQEADAGEGWVDTPAKFSTHPTEIARLAAIDAPHPPTEDEASDLVRPDVDTPVAPAPAKPPARRR